MVNNVSLIHFYYFTLLKYICSSTSVNSILWKEIRNWKKPKFYSRSGQNKIIVCLELLAASLKYPPLKKSYLLMNESISSEIWNFNLQLFECSHLIDLERILAISTNFRYFWPFIFSIFTNEAYWTTLWNLNCQSELTLQTLLKGKKTLHWTLC